MTPKDRRKRAHALAYKVIAQFIDSGGVYTQEPADESERDRDAINKLLDQFAQSHYNRSDL